MKNEFTSGYVGTARHAGLRIQCRKKRGSWNLSTRTMKEKPKYWVSLVAENKYPYKEYANHGCGGEKHGLKDLPDEYPYTIEYEKVKILWEE